MAPILPPQAQNIKTRPGTPNDVEASKDVKLFQPSTIRSVTIPNRIVVAPMCMYVLSFLLFKLHFAPSRLFLIFEIDQEARRS